MADPAPEVEKRPVETLSFEDAMGELEEIVTRLESGRARLEEAMEAYARGMALRAHCQSRLDEAESRVQAILPGPPNGPGGPTLRDVE